MLCKELPNGLRYPRVGGAWTLLGSRKNPKPEKSLENAADSHTSGARGVGTLLTLEVLPHILQAFLR
jgi:hypothetical protein